jgi:hypothetical protein
MKLRAVAMAACLVGSGTYARAYEYLDARGYRHWCQLSCERKGVRVPSSRDAVAKPQDVKVIDENDLAWEPPPGIKWQVVPDKPARAGINLFKPGAIANEDTTRP